MYVKISFSFVLAIFVLSLAVFTPTVAAQEKTYFRDADLQDKAATVLTPDLRDALIREGKVQARNQAEKESGFKLPKIQWEFVAVIISILSGVAAIMGFSFSGHKKKKAISRYMNEIDETFSEYRSKTKRCEAELYRLRDVLEDRLKKGKIDENIYNLLTKRIEKYLVEVQEAVGL